MKNIYFLGGLPRSGNTLLAAILNQNPEVYCSPLSPVYASLAHIEHMTKNSEDALVVDFDDNFTNAMKEYVKGFYSNRKEPVVIDRSKNWGSKQSIFYAYKYITDTPKVIFTVRNILNILTSFITLIDGKQNNFIDNSLKNLNTVPYGNQTLNDLRCDWLMNNQVGGTLIALTELLQTGVPVCLVEYDDLVANPQEELNKIYDFLEMEKFEHNFQDIKKKEIENLSYANLPEDLHNIRKTIGDLSLSPEQVLSAISLNKYRGLEFWRN